MKKETYIRLFNKFFTKKIIIHGIILNLEDMDDEEGLVFKMENPNNVSYTKSALTGLLYEELSFFEKFLSQSNVSRYKADIVNAKEVYVSDEFKERLSSVLDKKKKLRLGVRVHGEDYHIIINVKHVGLKVGMFSDEKFYIRNYVDILSFINQSKQRYDYETGKPEKIDNETVKDFYKYQQEIDLSYDSATNYPEVDELLNDYPLLVDSDWMANYTITYFV